MTRDIDLRQLQSGSVGKHAPSGHSTQMLGSSNHLPSRQRLSTLCSIIAARNTRQLSITFPTMHIQSGLVLRGGRAREPEALGTAEVNKLENNGGSPMILREHREKKKTKRPSGDEMDSKHAPKRARRHKGSPESEEDNLARLPAEEGAGAETESRGASAENPIGRVSMPSKLRKIGICVSVHLRPRVSYSLFLFVHM